MAGERFAQPEIGRLEDLRLRCLSERIEADLATGLDAALVGELEALVQRHPLRERLRGQLMLALYRAGRQADALAAYRDAHRSLVEGLGIEPSPELRALEAAILRQDVPEPAARPAERAPATRRLVTCVVSQLAQPGEPGLDPESLRAVVDRFHATGRAVFGEHGGSVVELRNDAVVAVLGIPVAHEDDAQRALRAAAELRDEVPFGVRSGACTGEVLAAGDPPVIGEAVAVAERLARAAASGEIRLAESTWQVVRHAARASRLDGGGLLLGGLDADAPAIARRFDQPLVGRERERECCARRSRASSARRDAGAADDPRRARHRQVAARRGAGDDRGRPCCLGPLPRVRRGHHAVAAARGGRAGARRVGEQLAAELGIPAVAVRRVVAAVGLEDGEPGEDTELGVPAARRSTHPARAARARGRRRPLGRAGAARPAARPRRAAARRAAARGVGRAARAGGARRRRSGAVTC